MRNIYAVILAGGSGIRMGGDKPKQFMKLGGKSLFLHSVDLFRKWGLVKSITLVCNKDWIGLMEKEVSRSLESNDRLIEGGVTRHDSTLKALASISWDEDDVIIFHDAARPFFNMVELDELVGLAQTYGSATLALKVSETIVRVKANTRFTSESVPRTELYSVKTPQAVSGKILIRLLERHCLSESDHPTDLCSWVEKIGEKTGIVETMSKNIKITTMDDLKIAESFIRN